MRSAHTLYLLFLIFSSIRFSKIHLYSEGKKSDHFSNGYKTSALAVLPEINCYVLAIPPREIKGCKNGAKGSAVIKSPLILDLSNVREKNERQWLLGRSDYGDQMGLLRHFLLADFLIEENQRAETNDTSYQ